MRNEDQYVTLMRQINMSRIFWFSLRVSRAGAGRGERAEGGRWGAALEDLQLGIKHFNHFKKIAMVSDISWIKHSINIFAPLIPADVKTFSNDCLEDAKNWILEN